MIKAFLKDSLIYGITNVLTKGISLILVPFYTHILNPGDYGVIEILSIALTIITMVMPMEITQAISRFFPDPGYQKDKKSIASTSLFYSLTVFLFCFSIFELFPKRISYLLISRDETFLVQIMGAVIIANGLFYFTQNQLRWMLKPIRYMICSLVYSLTTISLSILFVLVLKYGVKGVFAAQAIGGFLGFIVGFSLGKEVYTLSFSYKILKVLLKYSTPIVPGTLMVFMFTYIDRLLINRFFGLVELGLYGIAYRVASIVGIVMNGITGSITPIIITNYKDHDTPAKLEKIFRYVICTSLIITTTISMFSKEILSIIAPPNYSRAFMAIPFLLYAGFLASFYVFTPGLFIAKKPIYITYITIAGAVSNTILSLILIPYFNIAGAGLATALASFIVFGIYMYLSQKFYYVPHQFKILTISFLISVIIIIAALFLGFFVSFKVLFFIKISFLVFSIYLFTHIKLVDIRDFTFLFNYIKTRFSPIGIKSKIMH